MKRLHVMLSLILLLTILSGCSSNDRNESNEDVELTVSAAASMRDALEEVRTEFEKENQNIKIHFNFGSSGALQQQISQGAPVDLFISAAEDKFDILVSDQLIKMHKDLIGNEIVLVVPVESKGEVTAFQDLGNASKIAIGTPEIVPAGEYGLETLKALKLWKVVEPKLIPAKDVRQVLTFVETRNVDAGIVYRTDALQSETVKIVEEAPHGSHRPIIYPLGILKNTKYPKESKLYYNYLQGDKAMNIFKKYEFKEIK